MLIYLPLCIFFRLCSQRTMHFERRHVFLTLFLNINILCPAPCVPVCPFGLCQVPLGQWKAALGLCKAGMGLWKVVYLDGLVPPPWMAQCLCWCTVCSADAHRGLRIHFFTVSGLNAPFFHDVLVAPWWEGCPAA